MRRRGFKSHPVLLIFDNLVNTTSAHDVAAAYCLAMADVRVRLPLGALCLRMWESLALRVRREHETAGSNPAILTDDCGGARAGTGGRLLTARRRFDSCHRSLMYGRASQWVMAAASKAVERQSLEGSTPSPSADNGVLLAERQRFQASNLARRVRFPQSTLSLGR